LQIRSASFCPRDNIVSASMKRRISRASVEEFARLITPLPQRFKAPL